ncbi:MAG: DUF559 domain-containing protein [Hamadaea sp.]|nr:DUF559 domain-containing protein [Hamadaea sp.]
MARRPAVPRSLSIAPFRARDAVAAGLLTRRQLDGPTWRRLFQGIHVYADVPLDHRTWCEAAALLLPKGAAIADLSAAFLWGVDLLPPAEREIVHAVMSRDVHLRPRSGLTVHRSSLQPEDVTRILGPAVTTPVRTAWDLARRLPRFEAVVALDALLKKRKVSLDQLTAYFHDRLGWPGGPAARIALDDADPLAESAMESRMRLVIIDGGLPRPISQYAITLTHADGRKQFIARSDFAYPVFKTALEYDGDHHRERSTYRFDMDRQNRLHLMGWTVLRFSADDVLRRPDDMLAKIRAVLRRAGADV